ncbi:CSP-beta [Intoshia linei]|uniref:CSP-beta n=1 Tax=Intoshia linei TaxID=1819745 RepID=A0A177B277_9BILA|nr:CSP-beta [Intoshia linei]
MKGMPNGLNTTDKSYYELLELPSNCTKDEINKAYRKLAVKHHPDKNIGKPDFSPETFIRIKQARNTLIDDEKRKVYDQYGTLGIYIGEQVGYSRVATYFIFTNPIIQALIVCFGVLTGCFFGCFCCCFCCCFCFGKCKPARNMDDDDTVVTDEPQGEEDILNLEPKLISPLNIDSDKYERLN